MPNDASKTDLDSSRSDPLEEERALDVNQVAVLTGLSTVTLSVMRYRGEGPRFFKPGRRRVRYRLADVRSWIASRTVGRVS